jgi:hypothetical protein
MCVKRLARARIRRVFHKSIVKEISVASVYFLITCIFTWPLILHVNTHVIGPFRGDNLEYIWKIWWVRHSIVEENLSPWLVPNIYWPHGYNLSYGEITPLNTFILLPITILFNEVITYNLSILFSTFLSAGFTYLWLLELTDGHRPASFVGGLIFGFCPYRMARIAGHLPLVNTQGIPLVIWGLERFLKQKRGHSIFLIVAGFLISAWSSWYYAMILAILSPLYWLIRARPWHIWVSRSWFWVGTALVILISGCLVAPFLYPYVEILQSNQAKISLAEADFWSASILDYLLPNWRHPLWGPIERKALLGEDLLLPYEFLLNFGYASALFALFGWRRGKHPAVKALAFCSVIALILSFGPTLHILPGWPIRIPLPEPWVKHITTVLSWIGEHSLAHEKFSLHTAHSITIPLPALLIRWFVIGGQGLRSWGRFSIFTVLGVASLSALGLKALAKAVKKEKSKLFEGLLLILLGLLVLFEFYTGPQDLILVGPRPVDRWLAEKPAEFAIVQMPLQTALSGPQMFYSRYHQKNLIGGYGTYFPILFEERYPELLDFPSDSSIELLAEWPVQYVLISEKDLLDQVGLRQAITEQPRLEYVDKIGDIYVYDIISKK